MTEPKIPVSVAFALPDRQVVVELEVEAGITADEAVSLSGIVGQFDELSGRSEGELDLGIYGHPVTGAHILEPYDRVEIYRQLKIDPREQRRRRASRTK